MPSARKAGLERIWKAAARARRSPAGDGGYPGAVKRVALLVVVVLAVAMFVGVSGLAATALPNYDALSTAACLRDRPWYVPKVNTFNHAAPLQMPVYNLHLVPGGSVGSGRLLPALARRGTRSARPCGSTFPPTAQRARTWYSKERAVLSRGGAKPLGRFITLRRNVVSEWDGSNYLPSFPVIVAGCLKARS